MTPQAPPSQTRPEGERRPRSFTPPGAPMSPEQAARNRRVIVWVAVIFVVVSVAVTIGGFFVVSEQHAVAVRTDRALRSTAWTIVCYAAQNKWTFPTNAQELALARPSEAPPAGKGWPATQAEALVGEPFMNQAEAAEFVSITWPPKGNLAPVLGIKTNVSGIGTLELVNDWLKQFAQAKVIERAQEAHQP